MRNFKHILTYDYWQSDKPEFVESKFKLIGLIVVILVSILLFVALRMNDKKWDKRVGDINETANEQQRQLMEKLDSANVVNWQTQREVYELQGSLKADSISQAATNQMLNQGFNEILKFKNNEKNYIPNATVAEQLEFIQSVKYKPVR